MMTRRLLGAALLACACSGGSTTFTTPDNDVPPTFDVPTRDIPRVDRGMTPEVVDLTDVPLLMDAGLSDGPCAARLTDTVTFGPTGGLVAFTMAYTVAPPRRVLLERTGRGGGTQRCETTIPACGEPGDVTTERLATALADADVAAAFAQASLDAGAVLYGRDDRPVDGSVFSIARNGREVLVGSPCRTGTGTCTDAPAGVQRLVDVLTALVDQESRRPACVAALGDAGA